MRLYWQDERIQVIQVQVVSKLDGVAPFVTEPSDANSTPLQNPHIRQKPTLHLHYAFLK